MRKHRRFLRVGALLLAFGLVAAACGDDEDDAGDTTTTAASTDTTAATDTTAGGQDGDGDGESAYCTEERDDSLDEENGEGAGFMAWLIACAESVPLEAEGDPIVIGFQNPKGDPAGTFPEYEVGALAAVEYINNELGGVGADFETGTPGRPIQLEVCSMAINPADSQKCANELAGKNPFAVFSSLNFFGNHFDIYGAAGIPVFVGTPITVPDFTKAGVYAIGITGGCVGTHTAMVEYAAVTLEGRRVAVPWSDTPPGVVCYYDLEDKPLRILSGQLEGPAEATGKAEGLETLGVPIKPATADVTPQAQQVLDFNPDVIIYSAQSADCWNFVSALGKLGWTNDEIPLVLSGACLDLGKIEQTGELATGITFVGAPPITQPQLNTGLLQLQSQTYVDKMNQYGGADDVVKGFATQGFTGLLHMWRMMNDVALEGGIDSLTVESFTEFVGSTANYHHFGGTPFGCAEAFEPYVAVCSSRAYAQQWTGETFELQQANFSGTYIVAGTELITGPS